MQEAIIEGTPGHPPPRRRLPGLAYLAAHWRGEHSLARAYWLNGIGSSLLAGVAVRLVVSALQDYRPLPGLIGLVTIWLIVLVLSVWQTVGIWRSASRHRERSGRRFWAAVAKLMVVIGVIQVGVAVVRNAIPQIGESFSIVAGDPTVGEYHIRMIRGGTELEFIGGIRFGATEALAKALEKAPDVRVIHLNSQGGRIAEARRMRDLIRSRGLVTYTSDGCASACAIAFLGGVERYVNPFARLGFHGGDFPGVPAEELREEDRRTERDAVVFGVDPTFAARAYATAHQTMWYPTLQQLLEARYATAASSGQFALSGLGAAPTKQTAEQVLLSQPIYEALAQGNRPAFDQAAAILLDGLENGRPEAAVHAEIRGIIGTAVQQSMPRASDDAIIETVQVMIAQIEAVGRKDAIACHAFAFPGPGQAIDIAAYATADVLERDTKAMAKVLRSAVTGTPNTLSEDRASALMGELMDDISRKHSPQMVQDLLYLGTPAVRQEDSCRVILALYGTAMEMPAPKNVLLLRHLMSAR